MGLNDASPPHADEPEPTAGMLDDLAAYALDAVDGDDAAAIETLLATDREAATFAHELRLAAGELAAADPMLPMEAPSGLRERVLVAAHAIRTPSPLDLATAVEVHRIESERAVLLLRRLSNEQFASPVTPAEFAGWTIKDLASHLAANQALAAQALGLDTPGIPELTNDNVQRTTEVRDRHRALTPTEVVDEYEALVRAVDAHVSELEDDELERDIDWWGTPMRILTMLIVRSFETWTHADDVRHALGFPQLAPPAPSLATMSTMAAGWSALMASSTGRDYTGRTVELDLTGPGGGRHLVHLGLDDADLPGAVPDAVITMDIIEYCRAIGDRLPSGGCSYEVTGDADLARDLVTALPSLAQL